MYEDSVTAVRCSVGMTDWFKVEVGLHQGSALSPFLFAMVMDRLTNEIRLESPWTMMFADDIMICRESREQAAPRSKTPAIDGCWVVKRVHFRRREEERTSWAYLGASEIVMLYGQGERRHPFAASGPGVRVGLAY